MFSLNEVGAPDLPFFIGDFMAAFMVALFDDKNQACANVTVKVNLVVKVKPAG